MKKILIGSLALAMPLMAAAATFQTIIANIRDMVNTIIPLFMVVAVAVFLWGIVKYITAAGDEEKRKAAQGYIIWGLVGIFILVAFWGLVTVLAGTFGIETGAGTEIPLPGVTAPVIR